jgi:hypothetical protein
VNPHCRWRIYDIGPLNIRSWIPSRITSRVNLEQFLPTLQHTFSSNWAKVQRCGVGSKFALSLLSSKTFSVVWNWSKDSGSTKSEPPPGPPGSSGPPPSLGTPILPRDNLKRMALGTIGEEEPEAVLDEEEDDIVQFIRLQVRILCWSILNSNRGLSEAGQLNYVWRRVENTWDGALCSGLCALYQHKAKL